MITDLKPYPRMKDSGVPWLGEVPEHWEVKRFKYLLRKTDSRTNSGSEQLLQVSQYTGVTQRKRMNGESEPDTRAKSLIGYKQVRPGDLAVNIMLAWNGSMGVSPFNGIVSPAYCVYSFRANIEPWYYHYLLRSPAYKVRIKAASTGVVESRLRLYTDDLYRLEGLLPPHIEQTAIVRFLDHADRRIRRYIRAKKKLIALLEEQKQAIIHRAVTGQIDVRTGQPYSAYKDSGMEWLGKVPVHWGVMRLGRLITLTTGFPFKSEGFTQSEGDFRLLRGVNIAPGRLRWEEVVRWPVADAENFTEYQLELGDIVLGMDRPIIQDGIRVAEVGQSDLPSLLLQRVARIRPSEELDGDFALLLLNDKNFYNYLAPIFTGISVPHLSPEQIRAFRFTLPPIFEQTAIVRFLDHAATKIATAITRARREIDLLHEYRTRLIADVVTGKLDVRKAVARLPDEAETSQAMDRPDAHLLSTRT